MPKPPKERKYRDGEKKDTTMSFRVSRDKKKSFAIAVKKLKDKPSANLERHMDEVIKSQGK